MTHHMLPMVWNGHIIKFRGVILQVEQGRQATVGPQALQAKQEPRVSCAVHFCHAIPCLGHALKKKHMHASHVLAVAWNILS